MIGIYKYQNLINGKVYIGQSMDIDRRKREHLHVNKKGYYCMPFHRALQKYGIEHFSFEVLEECLKTDLNKREKYYIEKYKSYDKSLGYNIVEGGKTVEHMKDVVPVYQIDPVTGDVLKQFDSICDASEYVFGDRSRGTTITRCCRKRGHLSGGYAWSYVDSYMKEDFINLHSKVVENQKEALRKHRIGSRASEETKRKISEAGKGRKSTLEAIQKRKDSVIKPVICVETQKVYESAVEAGRRTGTNPTAICMCCRGKRNKAGGFRWAYD